MIIGVCRITLRLPTSHSLKDKRQIVRSITERVRQRYNLSIAEIAANDQWQTAALGMSCVTNSGQHAGEVLANALAYIQDSRPDIEIVAQAIEIVPFGDMP